MIIKLNTNQYDYINYSLKEQYSELKLKLRQIKKENQFVVLEIDEETADEIRDWAGEELQRKGFDINYELTSEGRILEEIIDLLYVE